MVSRQQMISCHDVISCRDTISDKSKYVNWVGVGAYELKLWGFEDTPYIYHFKLIKRSKPILL